MLKRAGGKYEPVRYRHSIPLAAMEDTRYEGHAFKLEPGDSIVVYTDGVTEATDTGDEMFGTDRLVDALNVEPDASPEKCIDNVKKSIDDFKGEAEQFDDITLLAIKYNGPEG